MQLGWHGLDLRAVQQGHQRGLHHVVEVVAQSDLIAAQLLRLGVKRPAPHPGAEVAGVLVYLHRHVENITVENSHGDLQQAGVFLDQAAVLRRVAGVHHEKDQLKGPVAAALKLLHQLCQQDGVLSARDAHGDPVIRHDQLIPLDRGDEGVPEDLAVCFDDAALRNLAGR